MAINYKVSIIGALDMLKFKNMSKDREKVIQAASDKEINVTLPINDNAKALHPDFINVEVKGILEHHDAKTYVLGKEDGSPLPYFRAGQYISVKFPIGGSFITRPYSIASSPAWALEGKYAITVKRNPGGFVADWILDNAKVGDKLTITAPLGEFYHEELRDGKNILALAGGSGITPFLSMAYSIADGIEDYNLTILFGNRTYESILFKDIFQTICEKTDKVKLVHVLSDEENPDYEHGFITAELMNKYGKDASAIYVCGPAAMYSFVDKELDKVNISRDHVRKEVLSVSIAHDDKFPKEFADKTFNVSVKQGPKTYSISAKANEPLLVAFERAGIKAPSRCRSGECGWCRSRLLKGKCYIPEANDGRRWADKKYNWIHPCASFPISDIEIEVPGEYL